MMRLIYTFLWANGLQGALAGSARVRQTTGRDNALRKTLVCVLNTWKTQEEMHMMQLLS